jgi:hypothetical protein
VGSVVSSRKTRTRNRIPFLREKKQGAPDTLRRADDGLGALAAIGIATVLIMEMLERLVRVSTMMIAASTMAPMAIATPPNDMQRFRKDRRKRKAARRGHRRLRTIAGTLIRELERKLPATVRETHQGNQWDGADSSFRAPRRTLTSRTAA